MSTPAVTATPNHATLREFCDAQGWRPSYGHQLKREGRLALHTDGKTVLVQESVARIAATRDPSKQGVADMHAATRAKREPKAEPKPEPMPPEVDPPRADGDDADQAGVQLYDFHNAKAKREHWAAEREHAAFRKDAGELIEHTVHIAALADVGATVRSKLETWASTLPPQLVGRDEAAVRATIADQVELLLRELADRMQRHASAGPVSQ